MFMKSITGDLVHVALLTGHAITIQPEGREVPAEFVADALKTGKVTAVERPQTPPLEKSPLPVLGTPDDKIESLKAVIKAALESGDESLFDASGKTISSRKLSAAAGVPVSAAERDQAWDELAIEAEQQA